MRHKMCFYGTLRKNETNYLSMVRIHGVDKIRFKSKIQLWGYNMYDLTYYPAITKSLNLKDTIVVELFDCDEDVYNDIVRMETNAGYYEELISIDDVFYSLFIMPSVANNNKQIESGDWVEFIEQI